MIGLLIGKFGVWIGVAIAIVGAIFGIFKTGSSVGKSKAQAEAAKKDAAVQVAEAQKQAEEQTATLQKVSEIEEKNSVRDSNAIADGLQQYARPDGGKDNDSKVQG